MKRVRKDPDLKSYKTWKPCQSHGLCLLFSILCTCRAHTEAELARDEDPQDGSACSHKPPCQRQTQCGKDVLGSAWPRGGWLSVWGQEPHISSEFSQASLETWLTEWEMLLRNGSLMAPAPGFCAQQMFLFLGKQRVLFVKLPSGASVLTLSVGAHVKPIRGCA